MNESSTIFTILTFAIPLAFAVICYQIAVKKNRNEKGWAILGFLFCFIAFAFLICLPKKENSKLQEPVEETAATPSSIHNESAAALNNDEAYEPRKPRISGSKSLSWYFIDQKNDNLIQGPFSINELRKQIQINKLDENTYVWCEEFEEWVLISSFSNASLILDADFIE